MAEEIDLINNPPHYTKHAVSVQPIMLCQHLGFNLGNAFKYCFRYQDKGNPEQDLKKAEFYVKACHKEAPLYPDAETALLLKLFSEKEPFIRAYLQGGTKSLLLWIRAEIHALKNPHLEDAGYPVQGDL